MKSIIQLFLMVLLCNTYCNALSLNFSQTDFSCDTTLVTASYDCNFNGSILLTVDGGVSLEASNSVYIVTNGSFDFSLIIETGDSVNFQVSTTVISSDMSCTNAPNNSASVMCTHDCIAPSNDVCSTADTLLVQQFLTALDTFTTANIGASGAVPSCSAVGFNDLWYCFKATSTDLSVNLASFPGSFVRYAFYDSCGGSEMACGLMVNGGADASETGFEIDSSYMLQIQILATAVGDQEIAIYNTTGGSTVPLELVDISVELVQKDKALVQLEIKDFYQLDKIVLERINEINDPQELYTWDQFDESESTMLLEYLDTELLSKQEYLYRYKIINQDGRVEYTKTVSIHISSNDFGISVYPNPVKNIVYIDGLDFNQSYSLKLYDAAGKSIDRALVINEGAIDISSLPAGLYFMHVESGNQLHTVKLSKL